MTRSAGSSTASRRNSRNDHFLELANTGPLCLDSTAIEATLDRLIQLHRDTDTQPAAAQAGLAANPE